MNKSPLQDAFLHELAETFVAAQRRIMDRLSQSGAVEPAARAAIIRDELRGLYHGILVILDGGTALADRGLLRVTDEDGIAFDRFLHEIGFAYWPSGKSV